MSELTHEQMNKIRELSGVDQNMQMDVDLMSDEDREWLDMPPIGAEFGASEDD